MRKTEVVYELKIRGLSTEGVAGDVRKRLSQALATNVEVDAAAVNLLEPEQELEECEGKYQDLTALLADYEGNFADNESSRIVARLWHLYCRVERIPIGAAAPEVEESKAVLLRKSKEMLDTFEKATASRKLSEINEPKLSNDVAEHQNQPSQPVRQYSGLPTLLELDGKETQEDGLQQEKRRIEEEKKKIEEEKRMQEERWKRKELELQEQWKRMEMQKFSLGESPVSTKRESEQPRREDSLSKPRYVPVYKWGLKFDGQSQSIGAFLQRVEETRRARGVTPGELFDSAVDLFTGPALVWYRSTIGRINTWGTLCLEMKIVFQSPDHDIRLQQEIFNRVQGETEHIDLFIASMEGLYGRLSTTVQEDVRLRQIFHNLNPQLQDRLALFDLTSIEQLRQLGRKAEAGRFRSTAVVGPSRKGAPLEPDLAYEPARWKKPQLAIVGVPPKKEVRANCWNCGEVGHRHNTCQKEKKIFCFGCGASNVTKPNCPKCSRCNKCSNCPKNA